MNSRTDTTAAASEAVERHPCPQCAAPAGSACRTRSGTTAAKYHTARFMLVPALRDELHVPVPPDRGPGRTWQAGPAVEAALEVPAGRAIRIGYARCSMNTQELDSQLIALRAADCRRIFAEKISTRVKVRPELEAALQLAREIKHAAGDQTVILTVHEMKRLARNAAELMMLAATLQAAGIQLELLTGPLAGIYDPTGMGAMLFAVCAVAAQLDRDYIRDKTLEGQQAAAARGNYGGRPKVIDDDTLIFARALRERGVPMPQIAKKLTIKTGKNTGKHPSVATLYRALADSDEAAAHDVQPDPGRTTDQAELEALLASLPPDTRNPVPDVGQYDDLLRPQENDSPTPGSQPVDTDGPGEPELGPSQPQAMPAATPRRVVDLTVELGATAAGRTWHLMETETGSGIWRLHRDNVHIASVQRSSTRTGRRGWRARLGNGVELPAHGDLAAAGSTLWRSRDLAAAGLAQHVQSHRVATSNPSLPPDTAGLDAEAAAAR